MQSITGRSIGGRTKAKVTARKSTVAPVPDGLGISESLPRNGSCGFVLHRRRGAEALLLVPWERKSVGRKKTGERVWVVNGPHPGHRAGQRPSRNGFSDLAAVGQCSGGGVTVLGQTAVFSYGTNETAWVRLWHTAKTGGVLTKMVKAAEDNESKRKFALYIRESTLEKVRKWYPLDDCASQSEFIEKAVQFYIGAAGPASWNVRFTGEED